MIHVFEKENHYDHVYQQLEKIKLYKKKANIEGQARLGFPEHRSAVFGMIKPRYKSEKQLSLYSRKHPDIYEELKRIGKLICPFEFLTIQVNKDCQCPPHKDKNNQSRSVLVSFGDYTGGEILIEGVAYNAYHTPIEFDGKELLHWNNPHVGTKYSIIFFS